MVDLSVSLKKKYNVLFLGERRIANAALRIILSGEYSDFFAIKAIVTNEDTHNFVLKEFPEAELEFISNSARNSSKIIKAIESKAINLIISVQHNWIIPVEVLEKVGYLAFNLHNARLPDYKGYNSISHAILNDDAVYESTIHWMEEEVDTGDKAFVGYTQIASSDTAKSLYHRTIDTCLMVFTELLQALASNQEIPRLSYQGKNGVFYAKDSIQEILNVTNITDSSKLNKIVRAVYFPPLNAAYIESDGMRIRLLPDSGYCEITESLVPENQAVYYEGCDEKK